MMSDTDSDNEPYGSDEQLTSGDDEDNYAFDTAHEETSRKVGSTRSVGTHVVLCRSAPRFRVRSEAIT